MNAITDAVEFEMSYDRRTGRPIASAVLRMDNDDLLEVLSEERFTGSIVQEAIPAMHKNVSHLS